MRRNDSAPGKRFFQTDRFFRSEGQWYFATREGIDFGPFTIREDGVKACRRYIETQHIMQKLRRRDPTINESNQWDDRAVADAAKDVSNWRLDRQSRPDRQYSDRSEKHK